MLELPRIARAEYVFDSVTAEREETPFGTVYFNALRPTRIHSAGLHFSHCKPDGVNALLEMLDARLGAQGWKSRWIAGFDPATFRTLGEALRPRGFDHEVYWALEKRLPSGRAVNPHFEVRVTEPGGQDGFSLPYLEDGTDPDGINYIRAQLAALGGLEAVAYLHGEPVSAGGMYVHDGVTRFTRLVTRASARGQGAAGTLIEALCAQVNAASSNGIVLCASEGGPIRLYEQLGFVRHSPFWVFSR